MCSGNIISSFAVGVVFVNGIIMKSKCKMCCGRQNQRQKLLSTHFYTSICLMIACLILTVVVFCVCLCYFKAFINDSCSCSEKYILTNIVWDQIKRCHASAGDHKMTITWRIVWSAHDPI